MTAEHGTRPRYYQGCHCGECTAANTRYQRGYRRGMRGPELAAFVDRAKIRTTGGVTWHERELPL